MKMLKSVTAFIVFSMLCTTAALAAKDYRERLMVSANNLKLRVLPKMSASKVPGVVLTTGTQVEELEKKGRKWVKIKVKRGGAIGWVKHRALILADPSKMRTESNIRGRGLKRLFRGSDQSGYGSAAAARGISSLGKTMHKENIFDQNDMKLADKITEFRVTGVPFERKARSRALSKQIDFFLREGSLGDYLP